MVLVNKYPNVSNSFLHSETAVSVWAGDSFEENGEKIHMMHIPC